MTARSLSDTPGTSGTRHRGIGVQLAAVVLAVSALSAGCSSSESTVVPAPRPSFSQDTTMSRLAQAGTVRIGTWFDLPPFAVAGGAGGPAGFEVEIATIIVARLGIPPERITWVPAEASSRQRLVADGAVDLVIATLPFSEAAAGGPVRLSGPYYSTPLQLLVGADEPDDVDLTTLRLDPDARVCSLLDLALAVPDTDPDLAEHLVRPNQVRRAESMTDCLRLLSSGAVRAIVGPVASMVAIVASSGGALRLAGEAFGRLDLGVGLLEDDVGMCVFVTETLSEAASSGSYLSAWTRTAGRLTGLEPPTLPTAQPCR